MGVEEVGEEVELVVVVAVEVVVYGHPTRVQPVH